MTTAQLITFLENPANTGMLAVLAIWSIIWKGFALWRAARNNQRHWFIVMVILNTFGILEIVYIFFFSKPKTEKIESNS